MNNSVIKQVQVVSVTQTQVSIPIHATGRVVPKKEIQLGFSIGGEIQQISIRPGQQVKKGQLLARLDPGELSSRELQATLKVEQAKKAVERAQSLFADSVITREQLEQAQTALANAEAESGIAEWYKDKSILRAPASGTILKRTAELSEQVGPGQPVCLFSPTRNAWVARIYLTGEDLTKLRIGDSVNVRLSAYPDVMIPSYIEEIGQIADPYTGTFEVDLPIRSNRKISLSSGLLCSADAYPQSVDLSWTAPVDVIHMSPSGQAYVWKVEQEIVSRVFVKTHALSGNQIIISEGISSSMQLIMGDVGQLTEGDSVRAISTHLPSSN